MEEQSKIKTENQEEKEVTIISEQERENSEDINLFFQKTVKNTISAFFLSLISTIINFTCNIPLLRTVSKESYGVVKVYFELAFTLVNFIPRETMRRTSQKFCADKDSKKENEKYIIISQINYLFVIFTSILSIVIFLAFVLFTDSQNNLMEEKDKKSEVSSNADLLRDKLAYNENVPNININAGNSE